MESQSCNERCVRRPGSLDASLCQSARPKGCHWPRGELCPLPRMTNAPGPRHSVPLLCPVSRTTYDMLRPGPCIGRHLGQGSRCLGTAREPGCSGWLSSVGRNRVGSRGGIRALPRHPSMQMLCGRYGSRKPEGRGSNATDSAVVAQRQSRVDAFRLPTRPPRPTAGDVRDAS